MNRLQIVRHAESAAVVLPAEVLAALGLEVGGVVEVTQLGRQIVLQPAGEADRKQRLRAIVADLLVQRHDAYERLA